MYRRRIYIIDKKFQLWFIAKNLIAFIIFILLLFGALSLWEKNQYHQGLLLKLPSNTQITEWAKKHKVSSTSPEYAYQFYLQAKHYTFFSLLWKPLAIVVVLNVIIIIISNIFISHKIAGPMYRLKKTLLQKLKGEKIRAIHFRKGDAFQDVADVINQIFKLK